MNRNRIDRNDLVELAATLDQLTLPPKQRALLAAIITIASEVELVEEPVAQRSFSEQFEEAFTPEHANFLVSYSTNHVGRIPQDHVGGTPTPVPHIGTMPPHIGGDRAGKDVRRSSGDDPDHVGR